MSNTFKSIVQDIKTHVDDIPPNEPFLIYIGVGTYAGLMTTREDGTCFLEPKNYHQYPPFLKELKRYTPHLHLHIVLIDPMQENPPYMIQDRLYTGEEFFEEKENSYISYDGQIHVNVLRKSVTIEDTYKYSVGYCTDISEDLHHLNSYCIENNLSLLYHDFTGRNMKIIAEYFDKNLGTDIDTIVYGFGARADFGCYFDLTHPVAFYPYSMEKKKYRYQLIFLNFYKFINSGKFDKIDEYLNTDKLTQLNQTIIKNHLDEFKKYFRDNLVNNILYSLRIVYQYEKKEILDLNETFFSKFDKHFSKKIVEMFHNKQISELFETLIEYYSKEINIYARLMKFDVDGYEMLKIITSNPISYKWCDELKHFCL
jgi:hypothetical protein